MHDLCRKAKAIAESGFTSATAPAIQKTGTQS